MSASIQSATFLTWPETNRLLKALADAGIDARFVGGCVRDALLGIDAEDVDCCTPALPEEVMEALGHHGIRTIPTGLAHGTITALIGKKHFEITTLRADVACDGRHAEVAFTHDYKLDAARRDFTINALSADMQGAVFDYYNGLDDLKARCLRFIGQAEDRIVEDALRILRLFRFQAQLDFSVEEKAMAAATELRGKLAIISAERIKSELFKLLDATNPTTALECMQQQGLWQQLFGNTLPLAHAAAMEQLLEAEKVFTYTPSALVRFAWLVHLSAEPDAKRATTALQALLKLSNDETKHLALWLTYLPETQVHLPQAAQRKLQRQVGTPDFLTLLLLASARDNNTQTSTYLQMYVDASEWSIPQFPLTGRMLLAHGFDEGATLGACLKSLEYQWENSSYQLTKEELLALAHTMKQ